MRTKIKKWIQDNVALLVFITAFLLDQQVGVISSIFPNVIIQETVKGIGSILLAYYWTSKYNVNALKKKGIGGVMDEYASKKIGGGGIMNPRR